MDEKRAHRRQLMQEMAKIQLHPLDKWQMTVMLDMSASGVSFTCATPIEKNGRLLLRFSLPGSPQTHEVAVDPVHTTTNGVPSGYRVGARFAVIGSATRAAIADYLEATAVQLS